MKILTVLASLMLVLCSCTRMLDAVESPSEVVVVHPADVLLAWNRRVLAIAEQEDKFLTLKGVRTTAMMHIAMHDALNAIDRRYAPYGHGADASNPANSDANPVVAAAQAGYEVAADQYPGEEAQLQQELMRWLDPVADGRHKAGAIALGRLAAAAIIGERDGDGWDREAEYRWHPMGPGVYAEFGEHSGTPRGFVFGVGWAAATPFMLRAPGHFRAPPPPAIGSDAYTAAFEEVKEVGRHRSATRTPDQTHQAMWWKDFAENSHNRLARQLVAEEGVGLWATARMFALLNMDIFDGYISVFENKFRYNHWRPYTAIRWADNDGNLLTRTDMGWNNLHLHTYAFPTYPSAHGTVCAAAMTVLADTFGDRHAFSMRTPEVDSAGPMSPKVAMQPATRSFDSFSSAAMECALSRVYLGIHFRYDSVEGNRLGRQIGGYALRNFLLPVAHKPDRR